MSEYTVITVEWDNGLELHIQGVGVTQTSDEDHHTAEEMVRDYLQITDHDDWETATLVFRPQREGDNLD